MTQHELARASGYAIRTIGKIEQANPVRYSSLVAIAAALNGLGADVSAPDLCANPTELVRQFVEAYRLHEQNMVETVEHLLSPNLEVFVAGDPAQIPFSGTYHGPKGLQEFWNRFFELLERPDKEALDLTYYTNGNEVAAAGTEIANIRGHDVNEPTWLMLLFRVEAGLIVRFEDYFDTAPAQARVELARTVNAYPFRKHDCRKN